MARQITVTLSDALYDAARQEALKQGRADGRSNGIPSLMRGCLRSHLNRNGWKAEELDKVDSSPVPAGRRGD